MGHRRFIPLIAILTLGLGGPGAGGAVRSFRVSLEGRDIGEARLSVSPAPGGTQIQRIHSALASTRGDGAVRRLEEGIVSRDGRFESGWARVSTGEATTFLRALLVDGAVEVHRDGAALRLPLGPGGEAPWTLLDAARDLAFRGEVGARRPVFDPAAATLGEVILIDREPGGWIVTEELGVRVRSRWGADDLLPRAIVLESVGLVYAEAAGDGPAAAAASAARSESVATSASASTATSSAAATSASAAGVPGADDPTGRPVRVAGRLAEGARIRLLPPEAFEGLDCADGAGRIGASGPVCATAEDATRAAPPPAGPHVRGLIADLPTGLDAAGRARWLAAEIARRLSGPPLGAAAWEATPEQALAAGAGDCNEAAAVFMAAAPLAGLEARRRTGLVLDEDDPALLWPHAWVEVRLGGAWVRVDPERGEAPARGIYVDLGDGSSLAARMRPVAAAMRGGRVEVLAGGE
jgi:hypothetical protein